MWDNNSIYPKTETGYAFITHKNHLIVNDFINNTFNQDGNEQAI